MNPICFYFWELEWTNPINMCLFQKRGPYNYKPWYWPLCHIYSKLMPAGLPNSNEWFCFQKSQQDWKVQSELKSQSQLLSKSRASKNWNWNQKGSRDWKHWGNISTSLYNQTNFHHLGLLVLQQGSLVCAAVTVHSSCTNQRPLLQCPLPPPT